MNNEKKIISTVIILLFIGFSALFFSEQQQIKSADWWAIYFENPQTEGLNFTIENKGKTTNFSWKKIIENNIIQEADIIIPSGEKKTIVPDTEKLIGKITIEIISESGEKKEIYKILN